MSILDVHKPVDVNERAASYGLTPPVVPKATPLQTPAATTAATTSATTTGTARTGGTLTGKEEVLRLAEEQLNVGKRQVEAGTTRIRRFVIEKPVESQITLHEEHCNVMRRAISDPAFLKDVDWSEKLIEVSETTEQAVVSKTARLAEEVVIRREGSDRVETVRETVRRQQVEVEHFDAGKAAARRA
jgi:uncharacterized protein (TIGR02271 family)